MFVTENRLFAQQGRQEDIELYPRIRMRENDDVAREERLSKTRRWVSAPAGLNPKAMTMKNHENGVVDDGGRQAMHQNFHRSGSLSDLLKQCLFFLCLSLISCRGCETLIVLFMHVSLKAAFV